VYDETLTGRPLGTSLQKDTSDNENGDAVFNVMPRTNVYSCSCFSIQEVSGRFVYTVSSIQTPHSMPHSVRKFTFSRNLSVMSSWLMSAYTLVGMR